RVPEGEAPMFDDILIESSNRRPKGGALTTAISILLHILVVGAVIAAGYWVKNNPEVIEKPIKAFIAQAPAPPPPPPPPPPAGNTAPKTTPKEVKIETPKVHETFVQPKTIPQDIPTESASTPVDSTPDPAGVAGGVEGGVAGGVVGGVIGGVVGGTLGGQLGGQLGGEGDKPIRVGGDVLAPRVKKRVEPSYTEIARKGRIQGVVIVEAIIDRNGNVTDVRVLKGLPMGLSDAAMDAVRQWKFSPGTLQGRPVPVIFNLTVNFQMQS
ncbi:MAG: TonB family protein, partial [Acidobacteriota bacterium]